MEDNGEGITNPYENTKESNEKEEMKEETISREEDEERNGEENKKFELMGHLFEFLEEKEKNLNVTSVGYFAKVINALLNKRFLEVNLFI